jgi:hypothetical protein
MKRDFKVVNGNSWALLNKLNSLITELFFHPDAEKYVDYLKSVQKAVHNIDDWITGVMASRQKNTSG